MGQHMRTDPGQADLFIQSLLAERLGFAVNLPIGVWEVWADEIMVNRSINFNFTNTAAGGDIPGHYVNPDTNVPNQMAIKIVDAGVNIDNPLEVGATEPFRPGPIKPSIILPIRVYTGTIRNVSPPTNDDPTMADPVDPEKTA